MERFKAAKSGKAVTDRLASDPNLLGVGVGPKETSGKFTSDLALKFFVRTKGPKKYISRKDLLPSKISAAGGDVITDVVKLAPLRARGNFTQRFRPAVGGCSGCVVVPGLSYTGTLGLGMRGYGGLADKTFILSNNHVLANENRARVGDSVIQPGTLDGGDAVADKIGVLFDFVPLKFGNVGQPDPPVNKVDAACAEVDRYGDFTREIFWIGYPKGWRTRAAVENAVANGQTQVQKMGRTTGYTTGQIAAVSYDGWVGYDSGDAFFADQILITPGSFSAPGDSGSCIVDMGEDVIGLLFAGGATHTIANFIEDVWLLLSPVDFSDGRV